MPCHFTNPTGIARKIGMKHHWMMGLAAPLLAGGASLAQDVPQPADYNRAAIEASLTRPLSEMPLTGTPNGIPVMKGNNSTDKNLFNMVEGQPIDPRPPEKKDDHPVFPGQTHAP